MSWLYCEIQSGDAMVEIKDVKCSDVDQLSQHHSGALDETQSLQKTLEPNEVNSETKTE